MKKITKERYERIKSYALECINLFEQNKNGYDTISYYLKQFEKYLNNDEEKILFRNMVLFPNSKALLEEYKQEKNITKLADKYGLQKKTIQSKISNISFYETLYEEGGYLNLSSVDVLGINLEIIKFNQYMEETIRMVKKNNEILQAKKNLLAKGIYRKK